MSATASDPADPTASANALTPAEVDLDTPAQTLLGEIARILAIFALARGVPTEDHEDAIAAHYTRGRDAARQALANLWASAQCTDGEIVSALAVHTDTADYPGAELDRAQTLDHRRAGRVRLRTIAWAAGSGECWLSKEQAAIVKELALQHAGWTRQGFDEKVRAAAEAGETRQLLVALPGGRQ